jgi:uncharacterized protein YndB with AHSA1/START domain
VAADDGELTRSDGRVVLRFRRHLSSPGPKVWRALSEPEHLAAWFPTTIEGQRAAGAVLRFGFRDMEAEPFAGEMLAFDPPTVMELQWGDETLRFELEPDDGGTVLVFTATFDEIGTAARDGAGWHSCLDLLRWEVAGQPAPWSAADRWKLVHETYVERFGPEAATIGPPQAWEAAHGSGTVS